MAYLIDKRVNAKNKSTVNRQKFLRRYKAQLKKAVSSSIAKRGVTDIEKGEEVSIPKSDISEPFFHQGKGGRRERILPGNDRFKAGDTAQRPPNDQAGGQGGASDSGDGSDDFIFNVSKDEYLELLFDDLELPNLKETDIGKVVEYKTKRAGISADGIPVNLNIVRSLRQSLARRIALSGDKRRKKREISAKIKELEQKNKEDILISAQKNELLEIEKKLKKVPFIDTFDLRYNNFTKVPSPVTKAVMFCLMDVSGSMDQGTKEIAKRFYILLYLFLNKSYKNIEVVFIRHHTQAKVVDEQEFFYSQETGGTIVSSALKLTKEVIKEKYPKNEWNIYAAQASDGDNWADDSPNCHKILEKELLKDIRYFSYIEISQRPHQTLWYEYEKLEKKHPNFAKKQIQNEKDIYPVFRQLFKKQN